MREPVHCRGATSKSDFPTIQASSCSQQPTSALKPPGTTVCLPSDQVVQIYDEPKNTTNITLIFDRLMRAFLDEETLSPSTATIAS
jgi:hypothetical protein